MSWAKKYTLDFGPTGDNYEQAADKLEDDVDDIITNMNLLKSTFIGTVAPSSADTGQLWLDTNVTPTLKYYNGSAWVVVNNTIGNLKLVVNASVNKLDIFSKTGGDVPSASHAISVMIPDGTGLILRSRSAAYLSGASQFILADGTAYWGAVSGTNNIKLHFYEIYDANGGIVHALSRFAGFLMVPTTTTTTDDDYFLLENGSTYTRAATDFCVCVGHVWANYNTANTPDWTFINTPAELKPMVTWNPKSDYGYQKNLATTNTSASDIAAYSTVSVVVKQAGKYLITGQAYGISTGANAMLTVRISTGSATYGSAVLKSSTGQREPTASKELSSGCSAIVNLNNGDTIHLGVSCTADSDNRIIYGDDTSVGSTVLNFIRIN